MMHPYPRTAPRQLKAWKSPALVFVKAEWCGHCTRAKPIIAKAAQLLGTTVPVYVADADADKALVKLWGVTSFPTILFTTGTGQVFKYGDERTADRIVGWVCASSGSGTSYGFCGRA